MRLRPRPAWRDNFPEEIPMAKAYMVVTYRSISKPDALAAYARIAGPAIQAGGGRFLVRDMRVVEGVD